MPLFRRLPRPATPPGTPAVSPNGLPSATSRRVPARLEGRASEPETLLAAGSAASLTVLGGLFAATVLGGEALFTHAWVTPLFTLVGPLLKTVSWAATLGVGLTSRHRSFRLLGWATALGAGGLYLWQQVSGVPPWALFGPAGALLLGMHVGNLVAWWRARRPRE